MIKNLRKKIINLKLYYIRSASYLQMVNTGMIFSVFIKGLNINLYPWGIFLFTILLCIFLLIGYLDIKLGFYEEELSRWSKNNKQFDDMKLEIKEIKELIKNKK